MLANVHCMYTFRGQILYGIDVLQLVTLDQSYSSCAVCTKDESYGTVHLELHVPMQALK